MQIASAFLMGTKIKEIEVPAEYYTKMTSLPNTSGVNVSKNGISYKGKIYAAFGREGVEQYATSSVTIKVYNGTSWSDAVTLTTAASEYSGWTFDKGSLLFFVWHDKMYVAYAKFGDYGMQGPKFGWVFDGTTWTSWSIPTSNLSQAVEKNGKLYLFEVGRQGSWNVSYWFNIYEFDDTNNTATLVAQSVAHGLIQNGLQDGSRIVVNLNGALHGIGGNAGTYNIRHFIINDDWSCTELNSVYPPISSMIVYKNKIHAFGSGDIWSPFSGTHQSWNSVTDSWEYEQAAPYFSAVDYGKYFIPRAIMHKNKMWLIGASNQTGYSWDYSSAFDDVYRYNR